MKIITDNPSHGDLFKATVYRQQDCVAVRVNLQYPNNFSYVGEHDKAVLADIGTHTTIRIVPDEGYEWTWRNYGPSLLVVGVKTYNAEDVQPEFDEDCGSS